MSQVDLHWSPGLVEHVQNIKVVEQNQPFYSTTIMFCLIAEGLKMQRATNWMNLKGAMLPIWLSLHDKDLKTSNIIKTTMTSFSNYHKSSTCTWNMCSTLAFLFQLKSARVPPDAPRSSPLHPSPPPSIPLLPPPSLSSSLTDLIVALPSFSLIPAWGKGGAPRSI